MRREFVLLRKAAIVIVAGASVAGAVGLIWILVSDLPSLTTLQLMGMLALILLPGATFVAWHWDRAAAHKHAPASDLFEIPEGVEFVDEAKAAPARDLPRTPGRASDQPAPHRRRKHTSRHAAERD